MKEVVITREQIEHHTPFHQRKEWLKDYLTLTEKVLTELSHENPCNYLELTTAHLEFTKHLLGVLTAGENYKKLLYEEGYFDLLKEEYEEEKQDALERARLSASTANKEAVALSTYNDTGLVIDEIVEEDPFSHSSNTKANQDEC